GDARGPLAGLAARRRHAHRVRALRRWRLRESHGAARAGSGAQHRLARDESHRDITLGLVGTRRLRAPEPTLAHEPRRLAGSRAAPPSFVDGALVEPNRHYRV